MDNIHEIGLTLHAAILSHEIRGFAGRQQRGFIAERVLEDFEQRDTVKTNKVQQFLKKYTTPMAFWRSAMRFVYGSESFSVEGGDIESKKKEYFLSLQKLGKEMFGKKWSDFEKKTLHKIQPETASSTISSFSYNEDKIMDPIIEQSGNHYQRVAIGVMDGIGGYKGGKQAAQTVKDESSIQMHEFLNSKNTFQSSIASIINNSANTMRKNYSTEFPDMGTTFAIAALNENKQLLIAYGGDSKIAVLKENGKILYLSVDHNLAYRDFKDGKITHDKFLQISEMISSAEKVSDVPPEYRDYWFTDNTKKGRSGRNIVSIEHVISSKLKPVEESDLESMNMVKKLNVEGDWVCVLALTDGVTDNFTPEEIATAMKSEDLIAGKITLQQGLDELTKSAKIKASENRFRSKPDAGITASGFTI